jgi:hypothetical protein
MQGGWHIGKESAVYITSLTPEKIPTPQQGAMDKRPVVAGKLGT